MGVFSHRALDIRDNLIPIIWLQGSILDAGGEAGTALGDVRQLTMTHDAGIGVLGGELL